ncbi:MAG: hypothetical protein ACE5JU_16450 [Candidatus Binatia bacterium]
MNAPSSYDYAPSIKLPDVPRLCRKRATLFLGTDRHIDEGTSNQEKRVGVTPMQAKMLREWLEGIGVSLMFYVIKDTGIDANCPDRDYEAVGATIVKENELSSLSSGPDVVHALKEPSPYESMIPGFFMRIGALHVGSFRPSCGLAALLRKRNFSAILDGSAVGGFTCRLSKTFQAPLRCSMSVFASRVAADTVAQNLASRSKVVISGGGVVGVSALNRLLELGEDQYSEILIIEADRERYHHLNRMFRDRPVIRTKLADQVNVEDLHDANGLILAAFRPGMRAPKVVESQSLENLRRGSVIVDVSID